MRHTKRSALIALALGDGYLHKDPQSQNVSLQIEHSGKQKAYLEWKRNLIHSLVGGKHPRIIKRTRIRKGTVLQSYRFTKSTKYYRILHKWFKEDGTKYSKRILKKLDAQGLAIWIMDDGTSAFRKNKKTGEVSGVQFKLSICIESKDEIQTIIDTLYELFEVKMYRILHMRRKVDNIPLYSVACGTKEFRKLREIIAPHMHESMLYKIDKLESPRVPDIPSG